MFPRGPGLFIGPWPRIVSALWLLQLLRRPRGVVGGRFRGLPCEPQVDGGHAHSVLQSRGPSCLKDPPSTWGSGAATCPPTQPGAGAPSLAHLWGAGWGFLTPFCLRTTWLGQSPVSTRRAEVPALEQTGCGSSAYPSGPRLPAGKCWGPQVPLRGGDGISTCALQNQLLTKGMVILRDKIRFYEGESGGLGARSRCQLCCLRA